MTELQHTVTNPDVLDRLLDRLGLALDKARTAVRLRGEQPAELELKGLSQAEFQLIEAYLGRNEDENSVGNGHPSAMAARKEPSFPVSAPPLRSAKVIWLNDLRRVGQSARLRRYNHPPKR